MTARGFAPLLVATLLLFPFVARSQGSIEEVADCAIKNLPPSAYGHAKVTSRNGKGAESSFEIDYWSRTSDAGTRSVVIARRAAPEAMISAYLFNDGDAIGETWAFTKKNGKASHLKTAGVEVPLFDTSLSLEDFARFARVVFPGQVRRMPDAELGGRKTYVVETKPAPDAGSAYSKISTWIDKEWCTILRRESFDPNFKKGELTRKVYEVDPGDVQVGGGFANPKRARQSDAKDGSTTQMEVLELELPAKVDDSFFTPEALPRAAR